MTSSETTRPVEQMLRDARVELAKAQQAVINWQGIVDAIELAAGTIRVIETKIVPAKELPIPRDAILEVMKQRPNVSMKLKQVLSHIHGAGLYDHSLKAGDNSYGTALRRLAQNPDYPIYQTPSGSYFYQPADPTSETAQDDALLFYPGPHPRPEASVPTAAQVLAGEA